MTERRLTDTLPRFFATRTTVKNAGGGAPVGRKRLRTADYTGLAILSALILVHGLINLNWARKDARFLTAREVSVYRQAENFEGAVKARSIAGVFRAADKETLRPPLYPWAVSLADKISPFGFEFSAIIVNCLFAGVLLAAVFLLVRTRAGDMQALLSVAFLFSLPYFSAMTRSVTPAVAVSAFTALCYCCYFKSDKFSKAVWTELFGISFGAGLLSGWAFILYISPLFFSFGWLIARKRGIKCLINIILPSVLVFALWLWANFAVIISALGDIAMTIIPLGFYNYITRGIWFFQEIFEALGLINFIIALTAGYYMMTHLDKTSERRKIAFWFLIPLCVLLFAPSKDEGILYPAFTALVLPIGFIVPKLPSIALSAVLVLLGLLGQSGFLKPVYVPFIENSKLKIMGTRDFAPPKYNLRDALEIISEIAQKENSQMSLIAVAGNTARLDCPYLNYIAEKLKLKNIRFVPSDKFEFFAPSFIFKIQDFVKYYPEKAEQWAPLCDPEILTCPLNGLYQPILSQETARRLFISVYRKKPKAGGALAGKTIYTPETMLGPVACYDCGISFGSYLADKGVYDTVSVISGKDAYRGSYFHNAVFSLKEVSFLNENPSVENLLIDKLGALVLSRAVLTSVDINFIFAPLFENGGSLMSSVSADGVNAYFNFFGMPITAEYKIIKTDNPPKLYFAEKSVSLNRKTLPSILSGPFSFALDMRPSVERPFAVEIGEIKFNEDRIEINEEPPI